MTPPDRKLHARIEAALHELLKPEIGGMLTDARRAEFKARAVGFLDWYAQEHRLNSVPGVVDATTDEDVRRGVIRLDLVYPDCVAQLVDGLGPAPECEVCGLHEEWWPDWNTWICTCLANPGPCLESEAMNKSPSSIPRPPYTCPQQVPTEESGDDDGDILVLNAHEQSFRWVRLRIVQKLPDGTVWVPGCAKFFNDWFICDRRLGTAEKRKLANAMMLKDP